MIFYRPPKALESTPMSSQSSESATPVSETKLSIMSSAARLFAERGYGSVGISEVGDTVGFGKGALYYHIKSKEDLLYDIMTLYMRDLIQGALEIEAKSQSAQGRIRALSRSFMDTIFNHRNWGSA